MYNLAMDKEHNTGRNSRLREIASAPATSIAKRLVDLGITADQVTVVGGIGRVATAIWALHENQKPKKERVSPWILLSSATLFALFDWIDGSVAREQQRRGAPATDHGAKLDGLVDSVVTVVDNLTQARLCHIKKDYLGEFLAYSTAITSRWPAIARKIAELAGKSVEEFKKNNPIGNHVGRSVAGVLVDTFPSLNRLNVAVVASNIVSTADRLHVAQDDTLPKTLNLEEQQKANEMKNLYIGVVAVTGLAVAGGYLLNRKK
jgi:hypothetical protein